MPCESFLARIGADRLLIVGTSLCFVRFSDREEPDEVLLGHVWLKGRCRRVYLIRSVPLTELCPPGGIDRCGRDACLLPLPSAGSPATPWGGAGGGADRSCDGG